MVQVRFLPRCDKASIPYRYLTPWLPSCVGEKVVVIRGAMVGLEYIVCKISGDEFSLAELHAPKVVVMTQPKRFLAVLSKV